MYRIFILFCVSFCFLSCVNSNPSNVHDEIDKSAIIDSAMVVSAHPLASEIGKSILKKGGNAIDAAIAVQFALAVVHPSAGNIGGGGFMVIRLNKGDCYTLDFREKAPSTAHRDMYLNDDGTIVKRLSLDGSLAVGVPGTVDGMCKAHQKFGSLSWGELIQPSIELAQNGFPLTQLEADGLNYFVNSKLKFNSIEPSFIVKDNWLKGDSIYLHDLANTLYLIKAKRRAGFYEGEIALKITQEMERSSGVITSEDLQNYESIWREPLIGYYKNYKIISMGPPSSGGACLLQMLKMLEPFDLNQMGLHSYKSIHCIAEAEKRAFADRSKYMGDPDFIDVPLTQLLDSMYLKHRMSNYSSIMATLSDSIFPGNFNFKESDQTTHYSIVDTYGNAVSVTTTLNSSYGSGVVVGSAGFLLNNEMDDFSSKPGQPNLYGLIGGEANSIQPNKRMLSSMTPTILEKNGQLFMVVGTPGGSTIITGVLQTILNVIEYDLSIQDAVSIGRFHHQWRPDEIKIESNKFDSLVIQQLKQMGHSFKSVNSMNRVDAIVISEGLLEGGADPRGDDSCSGF
ncbi:MAG: gamma-glutamyltransferase [Flavobacteriales bacterium]|nr:gamma-glutamyltransferase [Flavobacteriales bacterium]